VRLTLNTPGAETPWGSVTDGKFTAHLFPVGTNEIWGEIKIEAADAQTHWAVTTNLQLAINVISVDSQPDLVSARLFVSAQAFETKWGRASAADFSADWVHSLTNPVPLSGNGIFKCQDASTAWGDSRSVEISGHLKTPGVHASPADQSWAWWALLEPYDIDYEVHLAGISAPKLAIDDVKWAGHWTAPLLTITNLHGELYQGKVDARAELDVATRSLRANVATDVDAHKISPLLPEGAQYWLDQFSWGKAPDLQAEVALVLPVWTNRQPDWRLEIQPSMVLSGFFQIGQGGAFRGAPADTAQSHFSYSNMVWRLPDLIAIPPEGSRRFLLMLIREIYIPTGVFARPGIMLSVP